MLETTRIRQSGHNVRQRRSLALTSAIATLLIHLAFIGVYGLVVWLIATLTDLGLVMEAPPPPPPSPPQEVEIELDDDLPFTATDDNEDEELERRFAQVTGAATRASRQSEPLDPDLPVAAPTREDGPEELTSAPDGAPGLAEPSVAVESPTPTPEVPPPSATAPAPQMAESDPPPLQRPQEPAPPIPEAPVQAKVEEQPPPTPVQTPAPESVAESAEESVRPAELALAEPVERSVTEMFREPPPPVEEPPTRAPEAPLLDAFEPPPVDASLPEALVPTPPPEAAQAEIPPEPTEPLPEPVSSPPVPAPGQPEPPREVFPETVQSLDTDVARAEPPPREPAPMPPIRRIGSGVVQPDGAPMPANARTRAMLAGAEEVLAALRAKYPEYMKSCERKLREAARRLEPDLAMTNVRGDVLLYFAIEADGKVDDVRVGHEPPGMRRERIHCQRILADALPFDPLTEAMRADPLFRNLGLVVYFR